MRKENIYLWIVHRLPDWLIYWSAIRIGAYATTGKYGNTEVPKITFMNVLKRWEQRR